MRPPLGAQVRAWVGIGGKVGPQRQQRCSGVHTVADLSVESSADLSLGGDGMITGDGSSERSTSRYHKVYTVLVWKFQLQEVKHGSSVLSNVLVNVAGWVSVFT